MKRFICIFSAFMLLVGCVKNDPVTPGWRGPKAEIAFECPVVGSLTKSAYELTDYPDALDFRVWGYYSTGNVPVVTGDGLEGLYIDGAEFSKQGDTWASSQGKYYWPANGNLHFLGYAPSDAAVISADVTKRGLQLAGYTVPPTADQDLLVSQVLYAQTNQGAGIGAPIVFDHALTSIVFKVRSGIYGDRTLEEPDRVDTDLRVTKIELLNMWNTGNFDQSMTTWNQEQMTSPTDPVDPEIGWINRSGGETYAGYDCAVPGNDGFVLTGDYQPVHDKVDAGADYTLTNLILLPQKFSVGHNVNAKLRVTYDMTHSDYAENNGEDGELWVTGQVAEIALKDCGVLEWYRGYRYTYNITVLLNKIQCTVSLQSWAPEGYDEVEDIDIDVIPTIVDNIRE